MKINVFQFDMELTTKIVQLFNLFISLQTDSVKKVYFILYHQFRQFLKRNLMYQAFNVHSPLLPCFSSFILFCINTVGAQCKLTKLPSLMYFRLLSTIIQLSRFVQELLTL